MVVAGTALLAGAATQGLAADIDAGSPATIHIDGRIADNRAGTAVSPAGDVNSDGIEDTIIGAPGPEANPGSAVVVYGAIDRASINLAGGIGAGGFEIDGVSADDLAGTSVSAAGDINGDNIDDVIVGAPQAGIDPTGAAFVVYGAGGGEDVPDVNLSDLDSTQGFAITTGVNGSELGASVSGAGFFNNDGVADVVVGAPGTETAYVIYGQDNPDISNVNVDNLTPSGGQESRGMVIQGEPFVVFDFGRSVAGIGDFAGDGRDDIALGAPLFDLGLPGGDEGRVYVVYGDSDLDGDPDDIQDVSETGGLGVDDVRGAPITGAASGDTLGASLGAAGDFNAQGRPDLIAGAPGADALMGAAYVVFAGIGPGDLPDLDLATGAGTEWTRIAEPSSGGELVGTGVASAGDVNADDISDVIVGAPSQESGGSAYVVFGQETPNPEDVVLADIGSGGASDERGLVVTRDSGLAGDLGASVGGAGDADGDGRAEIVIGDPAFAAGAPPRNGSGVVYIAEATTAVSLTPTPHDFGTQLVGQPSPTQVFTFTNSDSDTFIDISTVEIAGADAADFELVTDACGGQSVAPTDSPSDSCTVTARFLPTSAGAKQAVIRFLDDAEGSPHEVALTGTGATPASPPETSISGPEVSDANPSFTLSSSTPEASFECSLDFGSFVPCTSPVTFTGLAPGLHLLSARALAAGLTDPTPAEHYFFVVAPEEPPAEPEQGETTNLDPVSGTVLVDIPNDGLGYIPIEEALQVPVGSKVDTTRGRVELTSATEEGGTQSAEFYAGIFVIRQGKRDDETNLRLRGQTDCGGAASAKRNPLQARKRKRKPKLWGSGSGNFSSQGNHGSASVRGTEWLIFEQCGGITGAFVKRGRVRFRDFYLKKTVIVRAGQTVLAKPPKP